jgi:hypothetical protein
MLTKRGTEILVRVERLMEDAAKELATARATVPLPAPVSPRAESARPDAVAAAERPPGTPVRGN